MKGLHNLLEKVSLVELCRNALLLNGESLISKILVNNQFKNFC